MPPAQSLLDRWRQAVAARGSADGPALVLLAAAQAPRTAAERERRSVVTVPLGQLEAWSDALASALRARSIGPCDRVGLDCRPSEPAEIVALLALLKCRATYVPVPRTLPDEHRRQLLADAGARALLTTAAAAAAAGAPSPVGTALLRLDPRTGALLGDPREQQQEQQQPPPPPVGASTPTKSGEGVGDDGVLNILYTSGSSGPPKGVVGSERGFLYRIEWMLQAFPFGAPGEEAVLRRTPLSFVDSVWEIWGALLSGTPLLLPASELATDPLGFWAAVLDPVHGATRVTLTPSLLSAMLAAVEGSGTLRRSRLRLGLCSGEPLSWRLARAFLRAAPPAIALLHLYGSTEVAGDATFFLIGPASVAHHEGDADEVLVPLGQAIPGTRLWVDREGPKPIEVDAEDGTPRGGAIEGELWVEGPGVALGYHGRPAETAARFIQHDAARTFKTGDWVRWDSERKALLFRGRRDGLVKVRGVRVGLEEAELRIAEALGGEREGLPQPALGLAPIHDDGEGEESTGLVAGLQLAIAHEVSLLWPDRALFWRRLRASLPPVMVPMRLAVGQPSEALPLTSSGKLDRRALLAWGAAPPALPAEAGTGAVPDDSTGDADAAWIEECFARIVGSRDGRGVGLFDRGGTSLGAMRALTELQDRFHVTLAVEDLARDVPSLARLVRDAAAAAAAEALVDPARKRPRVEEGGYGPRQPLAGGFEAIWRVDMGKCVDAPPYLVEVPSAGGDDGSHSSDSTATGCCAVAGSHDRVVAAVDVATGEERWRTTVGGRVEGGAAVSQDGGRLHVGCYDGRLYSLVAGSGDIAFTFATGGEIKCRPLSLALSLRGPTVVVFGSYDGRLYVLDEATGALLVQTELGGSLFASPVLLPSPDGAARLVTVTNRGRVAQFRLARDSSGGESALQLVEEWSHEVGCAVFTTPAVLPPPPAPPGTEAAAPLLLVLAGTDGAVVALDAGRGGATAWRTDLGRGPIFCSPLRVEADVVVGCQDGSTWRLRGRGGAPVWTTGPAEVGGGEGESVTGRPALLSDVHLVVTTSKGRLLALHTGTGRLLSFLQLGSQPQRLGSPAVREVGGRVTVVVGSRDDGLYGVTWRFKGEKDAEGAR